MICLSIFFITVNQVLIRLFNWQTKRKRLIRYLIASYLCAAVAGSLVGILFLNRDLSKVTKESLTKTLVTAYLFDIYLLQSVWANFKLALIKKFRYSTSKLLYALIWFIDKDEQAILQF